MSTAIYVLGVFIAWFIGAQIGLAAGYMLWARRPRIRDTAPAPGPGEDEIARAMQEREELIKSQKAFQTLMGYNADIAYGIESSDAPAGGS